MKIYNCDVCGELVYFENFKCKKCQCELGYLPIRDNMSSLHALNGGIYKALAPQAEGASYKKCYNHQHYDDICNWMIPIEDKSDYCISCRLTRIIPDLTIPENHTYWRRLEVAKRRLVYSLLRLDLPLKNKFEDEEKGLAFAFLADDNHPEIDESQKVMIGHDQGKITINIAEADHVVREKNRLDMNERYRTLLGHFRHEIGHYYWFLLIEDNPEFLEQFREVFGDERQDYDQALKDYYANGPIDNWQQNYVSPYATAHPWEDWAESWAHYLHMFDTLETASSWGITVEIEHGYERKAFNIQHHIQTFDEMKWQWGFLTAALNSLNRSMGMKDIYPFVPTETVFKKMQFVQQVIIKATLVVG